MGYVGQGIRIPFDQVGFQYGRDTEFIAPFAVVDPTANVNFHEGGISKRGGTDTVLSSAIPGDYAVRGLFDWRKQSGTQFLVFADASGKVYSNNTSSVIATGMSMSNYYHFSVFDDQLFICDEATVPQYWDGSAAATSPITGVATDWPTSGYPFQAIPHAQGASARMAYITKYAVFLSKQDDAKDASDAEVKKIQVYSDSGLVGGFDFGGRLFVFSKTKTYLIDDTDLDPDNWGYQEAQWEGGVAHWRLITKAGNNLYLMMDDGFIYTLQGVQATGDYQQANITRPAYIDRWIREKVNKANIENFHCVYDRTLRAIEYFVQVSGTNTNTGLKLFVDRPADVAWVPHNNPDHSSGFNASVSAEVRVAVGEYKVYTGDFSGQIWKHEQTSRSDDGNGYTANVKIKPLNFGNPRTYKHFRQAFMRTKATGNFTLTVRNWIDGSRKNDAEMSLSGTGGTFDTAIFDASVFADDVIIPGKFKLGYYGYDIQTEIVNSTAGEDFFLSEILYDFKELAAR